MIAKLKFWFRWWRWMLCHPSSMELIMAGLDIDSRRLIYKRWNEQEPKS